MPADDIDYLARLAYSQGTDPVAYAEREVARVISTFALVVAARESDPAAFPIFSRDLSMEALCRRILGQLLAAGWTPPVIGPAAPVPLPEVLPGDPSQQEAL